MLYLNSIDFEYDDGDATDDVPSFMVLGMMNRPRRHQLRQRSALRVSKASPFWAIGSTFAQPSSRSTVTQLLCRICSDSVGLWLPPFPQPTASPERNDLSLSLFMTPQTITWKCSHTYCLLLLLLLPRLSKRYNSAWWQLRQLPTVPQTPQFVPKSDQYISSMLWYVVLICHSSYIFVKIIQRTLLVQFAVLHKIRQPTTPATSASSLPQTGLAGKVLCGSRCVCVLLSWCWGGTRNWDQFENRVRLTKQLPTSISGMSSKQQTAAASAVAFTPVGLLETMKRLPLSALPSCSLSFGRMRFVTKYWFSVT